MKRYLKEFEKSQENPEPEVLVTERVQTPEPVIATAKEIRRVQTLVNSPETNKTSNIDLLWRSKPNKKQNDQMKSLEA